MIQRSIKMIFNLHEPPRATLTNTLVFFIFWNAVLLKILFVSLLSGHAINTKSLCLNRSSNDTKVAFNSFPKSRILQISNNSTITNESFSTFWFFSMAGVQNTTNIKALKSLYDFLPDATEPNNAYRTSFDVLSLQFDLGEKNEMKFILVIALHPLVK